MKGKYLGFLIVFCFYYNISYSQTGAHVPEMVVMDSTFSSFMDKWGVPGGSIAVIKDGRLIYARGFGYADSSKKELVEPHHSFRVASVSKTVTSMAIMALVDDGLLSIDDTVYGPEGILSDSIFSAILDTTVKGITIKHLLEHTGGWGFINDVRDPVFASHYVAQETGETSPSFENTIIKYMLANEQLKSTPGDSYFYSNFGFLSLGKVIEKVSGLEYEEYVTSKLLAPSGINSMALGKNLYEDKRENEVVYYDFPDAPFAVSVYDINTFVPWPYGGFNIEAMGALGGWSSSPTDLLKLLLRVDGLESVPDLISPSSVELMSTPSSANPNYALGWGVNSLDTWWHLGSLPGTTSAYIRTSNGYGWLGVLNTRPSGNQVDSFNTEFDNMIWEAMRAVKEWPTHNLFEQETTATQEVLSSSPLAFKLEQNYPNPFNPSTTINYTIPINGNVSLRIFDLSGRAISTLVSQNQFAGSYSVTWNASELASGIYLYRLETENGLVSNKKLLLIK